MKSSLSLSLSLSLFLVRVFQSVCQRRGAAGRWRSAPPGRCVAGGPRRAPERRDAVHSILLYCTSPSAQLDYKARVVTV